MKKASEALRNREQELWLHRCSAARVLDLGSLAGSFGNIDVADVWRSWHAAVSTSLQTHSLLYYVCVWYTILRSPAFPDSTWLDC